MEDNGLVFCIQHDGHSADRNEERLQFDDSSFLSPLFHHPIYAVDFESDAVGRADGRLLVDRGRNGKRAARYIIFYPIFSKIAGWFEDRSCQVSTINTGTVRI